MAQIAACGCTDQGPSETCERGKKLFAAAVQAFQALINGTTTIAGDERWAAYTLAHLAYRDHLRGWWEGDVKVQRGVEGWMISIRFSGRWIGHFDTRDENQVREWLQVQGYQQFVGMGEGTKDHLSGYYRKGDTRLVIEGNMPPHLSSEQVSGMGMSGDQMGKPTAQAIPSSVPSPSVDRKTQVTVLITLLIARIPKTPTVVERLLVQRRAANLLRAHGIQVGPQDERVIQELIEEAVQQKERMNGMPMRNSQALQK